MWLLIKQKGLIDAMKIKLFNITNRLKKKLGGEGQHEGEGFLDPDLIAAADRLIDEMCDECSVSIGALITTLTGHWGDFTSVVRPTDDDVREYAEQIFIVAHEIKDISAMCGYTLISYFAESLRDYVAEVDLRLTPCRIIVTAHIDAIVLSHKRGVKEDHGERAQELKDAVKKASRSIARIGLFLRA
jgi:AraC-like DNA-binding protein